MTTAARRAASSAQSSADIAKDLAGAIVERRLPPGTKLKEEALARLYAVSRTKVRAALLMLSKDELIEIVPEKGACVSRVSRREAQEIFAVRRALEAMLAREFVARASADDYRRIDRHLAQERAALVSGNTRLRAKLLADFHILLAEIAGNQVLLGIVGRLAARTSLIAMRNQSDRDANCSSDEHAQFIAAARAGDADGAALMMMQHLAHVQDALGFDEDADDRDRDLITALLI
ncbi:MAG: GntR family transcriptional regulator [Noviherbaspirillum sp.]